MSTSPKRDPAAPRKGDEAFKVELVAQIPYLRAFGRSLTGNREAADDLAQEALVKAWNARDSFQPGTNMKAWTFMILRNHFYSEKRRAWRQAAWDEEKAERSLTAPATQDTIMDLEDLRRAMTQLPEEQREALILVGAGGFAYEEAAEICGCAVGTIKSRVNRARRALEALMANAHASRDPSGTPVSATEAMSSILRDADALADRAGMKVKKRD
jgi:RNA polymerase sigma-70 factor (ECF subfamily)